MSDQNLNDNPIQRHEPALGVGGVTVLIAAAIGAIALLLPWAGVKLFPLEDLETGKFLFVVATVAITFAYPVLAVLIKRRIALIGGILSVGWGTCWGVLFLTVAGGRQDLGYDSTTTGTYLFLGGCVVLLVGIMMQREQFAKPK